jgi:hypothetical protein
MPALTRRRDHQAADECWHVYYAAVRTGTIAKRIGIPLEEDPWGWACGFYPGCHPRECTNGAAARRVNDDRRGTKADPSGSECERWPIAFER